MIAAGFEYRAPRSAAEAVALLDDGARLMGGGTWVVPEMQRGASRPARVVDLRAAGLAGVAERADGGVDLGAMTTYAGLLASPAIARRAPLLRIVAGGVTGGWAIRNQGTVGGATAAARPQSDLPAALVACGAQALIAGRGGERRVPVEALFLGAMRSALATDELLTGLELAPPAGAPGYVKLKRGASSWPIATAAAQVALDGAGRCAAVTLVLGGVQATPLRVDVGAALLGRAPAAAALAQAGALAGAAVADPWSDALADGAYRAAVAVPVARRALEMAVHNAREER